MTKRRGYALLTAIITLIAVLSVCIYVGAAAGDGSRGDDGKNSAGSRSGGNSAAPASAGTWVGAWAAAPVRAETGTEQTGMAGRSVRNVVHTSAGGAGARITLSNLYGQAPLSITHASIAVAAARNSSAAAAGTMRRLTFGGGATSVTVPAGGQILSDAVRLQVPAGADLLVTTYAPTASGPVTYHPYARQISYLADGDHAEDATGTPYRERTAIWRYLTAVDVLSEQANGTVVAFGDSITDGSTSTEGANRRWPDAFSQRLRAAVAAGQDVPRYSVVNEGISGNQILTSLAGRPAENQSGLVRFGRDVLGRPNVKAVVIDLGVNDVLHGATADRVLTGLRTLVRQAHAHGIKVIGATLMPFGGHPRYSAGRNEVRRQVNAAIRSGTVYDAVVDFDKALRDPYDPRRFASEYDSGDHLHPSDRGYRRMAATIDLADLKGAVPAQL
ncbi:SGNH/GDSL hydrolase family protein [Streptomyces sp. N50]|uniref:SGNH/GDSL hydrolase family protein n=1 Tax=Streptomyces sp. N50 TaxID=3081765 RepID=UPI0029623496|nr:SGNH/GDSL hydrolase family protein [Streptomyces sp. N50]WOX09959.1 SGNH/GDSL hydrolase family protein [Streptomyces sp. N50]